MTRRLQALALAVSLGFAACTDPPPESIAIEGRISDPAAPRKNARIRVEAGAIAGIDDRSKDSTPVDSIFPGHFAVVEGEVPSPSTLAAALERGVTSLVLLDGELVDSLATRDYVGTARNRGPRIFFTGPELIRFIGAKDFAPAKLRLKSGVRDLVAAGANAVVLDGRVSTELVCVAAAEAARQDTRLWLDLRIAPPAPPLKAVGGCPAPVQVLLVAPDTAEQVAQLLQSSSSTAVLAISGPQVGLLESIAQTVEPPARAAFSAIEQIDRPGATTSEALTVARSLGVAQCLGLDDALGRVARGYRADLVIAGRNNALLIDGVVQDPAPAFLAPLHLLIARWHAQARLDALFR